MYTDELFLYLDRAFGPDWRLNIDREEVKNLIDEWVTRKVGDAVSRAIDNLPEEF